MSKEMLEAFDVLEKTKGIKQDVIVEAMKAALAAAYKKNYGQAENVEIDFNEKKGDFKVMALKTVVDEVQDDRVEVSLKDALAINRAYEVGDTIKFEVTPKNFGRTAAATAKQVVMQRLREAAAFQPQRQVQHLRARRLHKHTEYTKHSPHPLRHYMHTGAGAEVFTRRLHPAGRARRRAGA